MTDVANVAQPAAPAAPQVQPESSTVQDVGVPSFTEALNQELAAEVHQRISVGDVQQPGPETTQEAAPAVTSELAEDGGVDQILSELFGEEPAAQEESTEFAEDVPADVGERAQKRIRGEIGRRKEAEDRAIRAEQQVNSLAAQMQQMQSWIQQLQQPPTLHAPQAQPQQAPAEDDPLAQLAVHLQPMMEQQLAPLKAQLQKYQDLEAKQQAQAHENQIKQQLQRNVAEALPKLIPNATPEIAALMNTPEYRDTFERELLIRATATGLSPNHPDVIAGVRSDIARFVNLTNKISRARGQALKAVSDQVPNAPVKTIAGKQIQGTPNYSREQLTQVGYRDHVVAFLDGFKKLAGVQPAKGYEY
jgi:hypothetical protein